MKSPLALNYAALPNIARATLPESYALAIEALAECARVDECKTWADKAAAIASYAKQSDDTALHDYATRIQGRAIRRCGELLAEFQSPGGRPSNGKTSNGGGTSFTVSQRSAAEAAGLSKRQEVTAARVANVPDDEFEAMIEGERPPTITQLAALGTQSRPKAEAEEVPGFAEATQALGNIDLFVSAFCDKYTADFIAAAVCDFEIPQVCENIARLQTWLSALSTLLANASEEARV